MRAFVSAALAILLATPAFAQQPTGGRLIQEPDRIPNRNLIQDPDQLRAGPPEKAPNVQDFIRSLEVQNAQDPGFGQAKPPTQVESIDPSQPSCPADATREYAEAKKCHPLHGLMGGRRPPEPAPKPKQD